MSETSTKDKGSAKAETTPGTHDLGVAASANPSVEQVTQQGGKAVKAEGQRLREEATKIQEDRDVLTLNAALHTTDPGLQYDNTGALVNSDGKRVALAADATDLDVGWTVQQAKGRPTDERVAHPISGGVPDQTVHPAELPDPLAAIRSGLLPQNAAVLNVDPKKFEGKKSLEP